jgi:hypothetical protein
MPMPVIRQPRLDLEPLAGEAGVVGERAGDGLGGAEGGPHRLPDAGAGNAWLISAGPLAGATSTEVT